WGAEGPREAEPVRAEPHELEHSQPPSPMAAAEDENIAVDGPADGDADAETGDEDTRADHGDGRRRRRRGRRGGRRRPPEEGEGRVRPPGQWGCPGGGARRHR